ncbi:MAG TPA: type II toxin-antitoxin system PrlF family antitoxin [Verrucomicrobiae bacterium]|jgi:bifunctional DNA-binding transcriptional regulator/antitoxin component of YhaV-PrlF toxin-antitoxin module|nr:type II toxin-antitoxin system PrlF family antitoxin [Verrucomicrobiae bacterium]
MSFFITLNCGNIIQMPSSTLTDKGQTTVPREIREALKVKPRQRLEWKIQPDGTAIVEAQPSALALFGSLRSTKKFPGARQERAAMQRAVGERVTKHLRGK